MDGEPTDHTLPFKLQAPSPSNIPRSQFRLPNPEPYNFPDEHYDADRTRYNKSRCLVHDPWTAT